MSNAYIRTFLPETLSCATRDRFIAELWDETKTRGLSFRAETRRGKDSEKDQNTIGPRLRVDIRQTLAANEELGGCERSCGIRARRSIVSFPDVPEAINWHLP